MLFRSVVKDYFVVETDNEGFDGGLASLEGGQDSQKPLVDEL